MIKLHLTPVSIPFPPHVTPLGVFFVVVLNLTVIISGDKEHSTWPSVNIWISTKSIDFSAGKEKIGNRKFLLISKWLRKCAGREYVGEGLSSNPQQPLPASHAVHVKGNGCNPSRQLPNKEAIEYPPCPPSPIHYNRTTSGNPRRCYLSLLYSLRKCDRSESMTVPSEAMLVAAAVFQSHMHLRQELLHTLLIPTSPYLMY